MKNAIAIAMIFTAVGVSAQQKLIGNNNVQFDEMGVIQYIDSSEYIYNSWGGSLLSNEPQFKYDGTVFVWEYDAPRLYCDQQNSFTGTAQPLSLYRTWNNTILNGNLTLSESTQDRTEYVYDAAGNTINDKYYNYDGSNFVLSFETASEYDASNNLTLRETVDYSSGSPVVVSIDSMFYTANQLVRSISYSWDGVSVLYPAGESLITHTGSQVTNIQLYEGDQSTPLTWVYDVDYVYVGGVVDHLNAYFVNNGVPETTPSIVLQYTYGTNNKVASSGLSFGGVSANQVDYEYDTQGFVTAVNSFQQNNAQTGLYLNYSGKIYYQSTVGVEETIFAEAVVFPNPSNDFVTIQTADAIERVSIYDLNGRLMITQNSGELNISNLPAGVYIAKVKTASGVAQARFVKQ
jgi:hypothetical protein